MAIAGSAAVNICVQFLFECLYSIPFNTHTHGLAGLYNNSVVLIEELSNYFPQQLHHLTFSPAIYEG